MLLMLLLTVSSSGPPICTPQANVQYNGTRLAITRGGSWADCCSQCSSDSSCAAFNWHPVGAHGQPTYCELQAVGGRRYHRIRRPTSLQASRVHTSSARTTRVAASLGLASPTGAVAATAGATATTARS